MQHVFQVSLWFSEKVTVLIVNMPGSNLFPLRRKRSDVVVPVAAVSISAVNHIKAPRWPHVFG